jgi:hypothetical protein
VGTLGVTGGAVGTVGTAVGVVGAVGAVGTAVDVGSGSVGVAELSPRNRKYHAAAAISIANRTRSTISSVREDFSPLPGSTATGTPSGPVATG